MKIRKNKRRRYIFYSRKNYLLKIEYFDEMGDLKKYLNNNLEEALYGEVRVDEFRTNGYGTVMLYDIKPYKGKADLRKKDQYIFRRYRKERISKKEKRWFAFSRRIMSLSLHIGKYGYTESNAKNLIKLFYKSGFEDFEPNKRQREYMEYYLKMGIPWYYWSDRYSLIRMKTVLEFFKENEVIK